MTRYTNTIGRTARRTATVAVLTVLAASGTAVAHGGGGMGGGTMNGGGTMAGGGGLLGGTVGLWGLLWVGLLLAVPLVGYALLARGSTERGERPLDVLRERYARGDCSDDEFDRRRERLERGG